MATGSAAARRQVLIDAGYRTGIPQTERKRCDTCRSSAPRSQFIGKTKYDMLCNRFGSGCKTHGVCSNWRAA